MKLIKNKKRRDPRYFLNETMLGGGGMLPSDPKELLNMACSEFGRPFVESLGHDLIKNPGKAKPIIKAALGEILPDGVTIAGEKLKKMGINVEDIVEKIQPYMEQLLKNPLYRAGASALFDLALETVCRTVQPSGQ